MIDHDYLRLGVAALFLVTNFLGAAFAIRRVLRARRVRDSSPSVPRPPARLPSASFGKNRL
jgi:hypothetical protein